MDKISKLAKSEKLAWLVKWWGKVLWLLWMIWAIYEVSWWEWATQAEETTPSIQTQYNQSNTPKIPWTTLSPWKRAIVNPEPQIFKWWTLAKENPMTTYTIPWIWASIWLVDLWLEVLSWTEEKVRKFINSYSKMSAEDKKSIEQELINLTWNK
jgi:hypothetical protein